MIAANYNAPGQIVLSGDVEAVVRTSDADSGRFFEFEEVRLPEEGRYPFTLEFCDAEGDPLRAFEIAAVRGGERDGPMAACAVGMIRIDAVWLAVQPLDMRAGTDTALARGARVEIDFVAKR